MEQKTSFLKDLKNKKSDGLMGFFFGSAASLLLVMLNLIFTLYSFNSKDEKLGKYAPAYLVFLILGIVTFILVFISYKKRNAIVSFSNLIFTSAATLAGVIFSIVKLINMKGLEEYTAHVIVTIFFLVLYFFLIFGVIKDFISYKLPEEK